MSTQSLTHYVPMFTQLHRGFERAVCGVRCETRAEHSTEPTCPTCAAYLLADAADEAETREWLGSDRFREQFESAAQDPRRS